MAWGNSWRNSQWPFWIPSQKTSPNWTTQLWKCQNQGHCWTSNPKTSSMQWTMYGPLTLQGFNEGTRGGMIHSGCSVELSFMFLRYLQHKRCTVECTIQKVKGPRGHDDVVSYKLQSSIAAIHKVFLAFSHFFCWGDWRVVAARPDLGICSTVVLGGFFSKSDISPEGGMGASKLHIFRCSMGAHRGLGRFTAVRLAFMTRFWAAFHFGGFEVVGFEASFNTFKE